MVWIYHERQQSALCGQHSLNNLLQRSQFDPVFLSEIAFALDQREMKVIEEASGKDSNDYRKRKAEGSGNVDASGNFSIEVLRSALQTHSLTLVSYMSEAVKTSSIDLTSRTGFILNRDHHWFTIRQINNNFWNLNSMLEKPETISHFKLAAEVEAYINAGYSVFCCLDSEGAHNGTLPDPAVEEWECERGVASYWWKEEDLLKGKSNNYENHAWRNVGSGMRLDGKTTTSSRSASGDGGQGTEDEQLQKALLASMGEQGGSMRSVEEMSEEEQMRLAIEQSMRSEEVSKEEEDVGDEPAESDPSAVKLQIRLPNGKRVIRRFLETSLVAKIYGYVKNEDGGSGTLELRAGFPPKSIAAMKTQTIGEAGLKGESLNGRWT